MKKESGGRPASGKAAFFIIFAAGLIVLAFYLIKMDKVTEETKLFDDLGLDSLSIMLFAMEIEAAFNYRFTEPVKFVTVGDVCKFLEEKGL